MKNPLEVGGDTSKGQKKAAVAAAFKGAMGLWGTFAQGIFLRQTCLYIPTAIRHRLILSHFIPHLNNAIENVAYPCVKPQFLSKTIYFDFIILWIVLKMQIQYFY